MPAVTVPDINTLVRLAQQGASARPRVVQSLTTSTKGFEGEGFPVRRAFAGVGLQALDPFVHLDQMGEVDYAPGEPKGTPWHPHRGFETVTYMIDGIIDHHDSTGGGGRITDGDTQWMTAGSGLLHIETPPEALVNSGGLFHGLQLWVNLPRAKKWIDPSYQELKGNKTTLVASYDGGALLRLIAGDIAGHRGPGSTHSPIAMAHVTIEPGARLITPWPNDFNALVYVLSGDGFVGKERVPASLGQLAVMGDGETISVEASEKQSRDRKSMEVLMLGGRPLDEPIAWHGPFVMNTDAEIRQAFEDFQAGRLGVVPPDVHAATDDVVEQIDSALD